MLKVGLTGGIGSGKSIVCEVFSALGISVYHADQMAKRLIQSDSNLKLAIIKEFGKESFTEKGYNTSHIASLVFSDKELLNKLNLLIHPFVANDFLTWCSRHNQERYVIQEAAVLFESGANAMTDYTILVDAPLNMRISRVMKRDDITKEEVLARINSQWPTEKIISLADWVIKNNDKNLILPQVLNLHNQLISISEIHG